jgi:hypothetical protein
MPIAETHECFMSPRVSIEHWNLNDPSVDDGVRPFGARLDRLHFSKKIRRRDEVRVKLDLERSVRRTQFYYSGKLA